jgi:hypothetical protein
VSFKACSQLCSRILHFSLSGIWTSEGLLYLHTKQVTVNLNWQNSPDCGHIHPGQRFKLFSNFKHMVWWQHHDSPCRWRRYRAASEWGLSQ